MNNDDSNNSAPPSYGFVRNTEVVTSNDYDRMTSEASQPEAPVQVDFTTARTTSGQRIPDIAALTPDSLLTVGNTETSVSVLLQLGLITRDPRSGLLRATTG